MSNIQTGADRMPHGLANVGILAGQIGFLINISTTPVIAGDSFEMDAVGALRLSPLRRGLAIDSTVDIFTFYVPHRHVYGEQWIKFMKDGVNATPLPTVNTTGYIDHAAFLGTINFVSNKRRHTRLQGDWSSDVCSSNLRVWVLNGLGCALDGIRVGKRMYANSDGSVERKLDSLLALSEALFHSGHYKQAGQTYREA